MRTGNTQTNQQTNKQTNPTHPTNEQTKESTTGTCGAGRGWTLSNSALTPTVERTREFTNRGSALRRPLTNNPLDLFVSYSDARHVHLPVVAPDGRHTGEAQQHSICVVGRHHEPTRQEGVAKGCQQPKRRPLQHVKSRQSGYRVGCDLKATEHSEHSGRHDERAASTHTRTKHHLVADVRGFTRRHDSVHVGREAGKGQCSRSPRVASEKLIHRKTKPPVHVERHRTRKPQRRGRRSLTLAVAAHRVTRRVPKLCRFVVLQMATPTDFRSTRGWLGVTDHAHGKMELVQARDLANPIPEEAECGGLVCSDLLTHAEQQESV